MMNRVLWLNEKTNEFINIGKCKNVKIDATQHDDENSIDGTISNLMLDKKIIPEIFKWWAPISQRWPIHIVTNSGIIKYVWFKNFGLSYSTDDRLIATDVGFTAEKLRQ